MLFSVTPKAPAARNERALLKKPAGPPFSHRTTSAGRSALRFDLAHPNLSRASMPARPAAPPLIAARRVNFRSAMPISFATPARTDANLALRSAKVQDIDLMRLIGNAYDYG